ncbi:TIGR02611 family protein [Streptosporangium canum]|uniref:TIGR02611 family protein n=1 Tax=Streptosporangium canum TaxID=324952 RepID=UPI0036871AA2
MAISDGVRNTQDGAEWPSETGGAGASRPEPGHTGASPSGAGAAGTPRFGTGDTGSPWAETGDAGTARPGTGSPWTETGDADVLKDEAARRSGIHGWLDGVRSTRTGHLTLKVVIGVIGAMLVIAGLIMVPFPGPGWLVVFAGLAVLATEFHWARRLLEFGKRTLSAWTTWLGRRGWTVKILVVLVAAVAATAIVYYGLKLSLGLDLVTEAQKLINR